jgi:Cu+-exporting ATPase
MEDKADAHRVHGHSSRGSTPAAVRDPVCGMDVVPGDAPGGSALHGGVKYWFCSAACRQKFIADPTRYVASVAPSLPVRNDDRIYTCPMHPEVRQKGPGTCPKCGMALEPEAPTTEEGPNAELIDMTRRFWLSLILTIPILGVAMAEMIAPRLVD